jgi:hypothetical protein
MINEGKIDAVIAAVKANPLPRSGISVEFLDALQAHVPAAKRPPVSISASLKAELARTRHDVPVVTPEQFLADLPEAETASRLPDYSSGSGPWFGGNDDSVAFDGYRVGKPDAEGARVVRFKGTQSSPASMIEEATLLRCAELARADGKKGFIVVSREDIETTVTTTYYSIPLRTDPGGYQTALRVLSVDPANLPDKYKDAAWRVFDADEVYAALAPVYIKQKRK